MKQIALILLSFILPEFLHSQEIQSELNITTTLNVIEASNELLDTTIHVFPLFYTLTKFHADVKKLSDEELIRNADIFIQGEVVYTILL